MEKVVRVSIAQVAFVLEEEAYQRLDAYLNELKAYYNAHENGSEIIDGIEERMADLFLERIPNGSVVPATAAEEVIALLGRPDDIGQEAGEAPKDPAVRTVVKRLYRDPDRRVLGGVCSGLSAYFNIDVVWVRLLFVGFALVAPLIGKMFYMLFFGKSVFWVLGAYIVLWIVVPKARTVAQKCAMRGETFSISGIERDVEGNYRSGAPNDFWKGIGRALLFCTGMLLAICGISGMLLLVIPFFALPGCGQPVFHDDFGRMVQIVLNLSAPVLYVLKFALLLAVALPFIGMLYTGIRWLFRFKSPRWRPGLVIFLSWIAALITTVSLSVYSASPYFDTQHLHRQEQVEARDTLYIKYDRLEEFPNDRLTIHADKSDYRFALLDKAGAQLITWPYVDLSRRKAHRQLTIHSKTVVFRNQVEGGDLQEIRDLSFYRIAGDTLFLKPLIYSKEHKISEVNRSVVLDIHPGTRVIIEKPVSHRFDTQFEHNRCWLFPR